MSVHKPTLNQQKAIDCIDGPVRVLAGPGTGKTEILSLRIAHMLDSDVQIDAGNILCITYTDAARVNMRQRLAAKVGTATAQRIAIHTYHSFCGEVILQYGQYFNKSELLLLSELENLKIVQEIIDKLPSTSRLVDAKRPYASVSNLVQLYDTIKQENLTVDAINQSIDRHIQEDIVENEKLYYKRKTSTSNVGDKKEEYYTKLESMERLREAVHTFPVYTAALKHHGRYDFSDMIHWVIDLFEQQPNILSDYAERYMYLMVDEYQDTNGTQNRLIELLADASGDNAPNLFVVGDDDQSIFRFQGASSANMRMVERKYASALQDVQLTDNFRSTQAILDFAENFVKANTTRIKQNFNGLTSYSSAENIWPQCVGLPNVRQEFVYITERIKALVNKGVPTQEIAVLMTKNKHLARLAQYLAHAGIPSYIKKQNNLLEEPLVKQLLLLLRYLYQESTHSYSGGNLLFQVLHLPSFHIPANDIAMASYMCSQSSVRDFRRFLCSVHEGTLVAEIAEQNSLRKEQFAVAPKILEINAVLEKLIADASVLNAYQTFRNTIHQCNIHFYILTHSHKIDLLDQLSTFFDFIEAETTARPDLGLPQLMEEITALENSKVPILRSRAFGNDTGVQLLTIHGSKGLEFEHVFVAGHVAGNWEKKRPPSSGFTLPHNLMQDIQLQKQGGDKMDDEHHENRRLLYVAYTRAKKTLTCTFHKKDKNNKEIEPSGYLLEAFKSLEGSTVDEQDEITEAILAQYEPVDRQEDDDVVALAEMEQNLIRKHCETLSMSVSSLNKYLECPIAYYYEKVLAVPSGINENMSFGSAVHDALEAFFNASKAKNAWLNLDQFLELFERIMWQRRRNFTPTGAANYLQHGKQVIAANYNTFIDEWQLGSEIEWRPPTKVLFNGIPLSGFLDRVDVHGNTCNIVDYKTGNVDKKDKVSEKFKIGGSYNSKKDCVELGGDYWRQAAFYKLLINECADVQWEVISAEFVYVEPSKLTGNILSKKVVVTDTDLLVVEKQIIDTYQNIQDHKFIDGCGEKFCTWCNFTKANEQLREQ